MTLTCLFKDTEYNACISVEVPFDSHSYVPEQGDHMGLHRPAVEER